MEIVYRKEENWYKHRKWSREAYGGLLTSLTCRERWVEIATFSTSYSFDYAVAPEDVKFYQITRVFPVIRTDETPEGWITDFTCAIRLRDLDMARGIKKSKSASRTVHEEAVQQMILRIANNDILTVDKELSDKGRVGPILYSRTYAIGDERILCLGRDEKLRIETNASGRFGSGKSRVEVLDMATNRILFNSDVTVSVSNKELKAIAEEIQAMEQERRGGSISYWQRYEVDPMVEIEYKQSQRDSLIFWDDKDIESEREKIRKEAEKREKHLRNVTRKAEEKKKLQAMQSYVLHLLMLWLEEKKQDVEGEEKRMFVKHVERLRRRVETIRSQYALGEI